MKFYEQKYILNEGYSYSCSFLADSEVRFEIKVPRCLATTEAYMQLFGEGIENKFRKKIKLLWSSIYNEFDVYSCTIKMSDLGIGLYYYKYELNSLEFLHLGEGKGVGELEIVEPYADKSIQLMVYKQEDFNAKWMFGGIMYQIFVDRFKKGGNCKPKDYAIINEDWYNGIPQFADKPGGYVENNMFFGGDLYGVIEKLDYLKELGVTCLYLCPIFDAHSNHKYDTSDYMSVDQMFGSEEAFDSLIKEIKKRDMHIILDGVFNHTGADSIYFNRDGRYSSVGAYQSKESPYYEWYNFKKYPDEYECWWNVKILPRVNSECPSYREFINGDGGVIEKWAKKGIDGFRLDVADELSDSFLQQLNKKLKSINPNGIVYGEVWEDASNKIAYGKRKKYFLGNELDSVMNYPLRTAIVNYIKYGDFQGFNECCKMIYTHYPKYDANLLMNSLGTHDTERILTVLGGDDGSMLTNKELSTKRMSNEQLIRAKKPLKLASVVLYTMPGIPCIYYGDEAGMEGYRDPFNRMPYPWGKEDKELIEFYKEIGKIRASEPLYKDGNFKILYSSERCLLFARCDNQSSILTLVNRSDNDISIKSMHSLVDLFDGKEFDMVSSNSFKIFKINKCVSDIFIEINE